MIAFYKMLEGRWEKVEWDGMPTRSRMDEEIIYRENCPPNAALHREGTVLPQREIDKGKLR